MHSGFSVIECENGVGRLRVRFLFAINSQEQHEKEQSKSNSCFLLNSSDAGLRWLFIQPRCVHAHEIRAIIETGKMTAGE